MKTGQFWSIISSAREGIALSDTNAFYDKVLAKLCDLPLEDIVAWKVVLDEYLYHTRDNRKLVCACAAVNRYASDDEFLYFNAWLISLGKDIYMSVVSNPDSLADVDFNIGRCRADFENLIYVAGDAYKLRKDFEGEASSLDEACAKWFDTNRAVLVADIKKLKKRKGRQFDLSDEDALRQLARKYYIELVTNHAEGESIYTVLHQTRGSEAMQALIEETKVTFPPPPEQLGNRVAPSITTEEIKSSVPHLYEKAQGAKKK